LHASGQIDHRQYPRRLAHPVSFSHRKRNISIAQASRLPNESVDASNAFHGLYRIAIRLHNVQIRALLTAQI